MRGSLIFFGVCMALLSCSKEKNYEDILVIGHGAMGLENLNSFFHDNSLEAYEFALTIDGCNGVELDVQLSKDGKLWFYHDSGLQSETNGGGCIPDRTSAELSDITYSSVHHEKLFSLEQLDTAFLVGKKLFLDLRHYNECQGDYVSLDQVLSQLEYYGLKHPTSFSVHCITGRADWLAPLITAGFKVCFPVYSMEEVAHYQQLYPDLEGFIVKNNNIRGDEVMAIKQSNKKVYIFEVRSPKGIRSAMKKRPDGIITDDIRATLIEKY